MRPGFWRTRAVVLYINSSVMPPPGLEEVRRFEALAHDIHRRHAQAGAAADDGDVAVEVHVRDTDLLRGPLDRVVDPGQGVLGHLGMPEEGRVVHLQDRVHRPEVLVRRHDERVHLGDHGVALPEHAVERDQHVGDLDHEVAAESRLAGERAGLVAAKLGGRDHGLPEEGVRPFFGHRLHIDAAGGAEDHRDGARRPRPRSRPRTTRGRWGPSFDTMTDSTAKPADRARRGARRSSPAPRPPSRPCRMPPCLPREPTNTWALITTGSSTLA